MNCYFFPVPSPWFRHSNMLKSLMHCTYSVKKKKCKGRSLCTCHTALVSYEKATLTSVKNLLDFFGHIVCIPCLREPASCWSNVWICFACSLENLLHEQQPLCAAAKDEWNSAANVHIAISKLFMTMLRVREFRQCFINETILSCSCRRGRYRLTEKMEVIVCF